MNFKAIERWECLKQFAVESNRAFKPPYTPYHAKPGCKFIDTSTAPHSGIVVIGVDYTNPNYPVFTYMLFNTHHLWLLLSGMLLQCMITYNTH